MYSVNAIKCFLLIVTTIMLCDTIFMIPHYQDLTQVEMEKDSSEEEKEESKKTKEHTSKLVKWLSVDFTRYLDKKMAFARLQSSNWHNPAIERFGPPPELS